MYRHRFTDFTNALIPVYDKLFHAWMGKAHEQFRGRVLELAALRSGERILDAGCGTGLTASRIVERCPGVKVAGIDISPRMIAAARRNAETQGLRAEFRVGSITALPYPDGSFDAVITCIMFHHLDLSEKRRAVGELARVLKAGGRYISAEFGPRAANALQRRLAKGDYTLYPSHLEEAGFVIMRYEIGPFALGKKVCYRTAVKPDRAAAGPA
ncbi:MAG: methyltransferase domain-containing protein [Anaerolineales bacterium]|nr:methyltransferase domain-containing protein [Anaerolineales bacterium]